MNLGLIHIMRTLPCSVSSCVRFGSILFQAIIFSHAVEHLIALSDRWIDPLEISSLVKLTHYFIVISGLLKDLLELIQSLDLLFSLLQIEIVDLSFSLSHIFLLGRIISNLRNWGCLLNLD